MKFCPISEYTIYIEMDQTSWPYVVLTLENHKEVLTYLAFNVLMLYNTKIVIVTV